MVNSQFLIQNAVQVEIFIPKNTSTNQLVFNFPDQPYLRDKKITAVMLSMMEHGAYSGAVNVNTDIVSNQSTPAYLLNTSVFLTLQNKEGMQIVQNMPLVELNPYNLNAIAVLPDQGPSKYNIDGMLAIQPQTIVWTKSYISAPSPIISSAIYDRCFQFTVFFQS
jgi:hypothetical protein